MQNGLDAIPEEHRRQWNARIGEAEQKQPRDFPANGWAGGAMQAAWSAITHDTTLVHFLECAVRGGNRTDTAAATTRGLAGAGMSPAPSQPHGAARCTAGPG